MFTYQNMYKADMYHDDPKHTRDLLVNLNSIKHQVVALSIVVFRFCSLDWLT